VGARLETELESAIAAYWTGFFEEDTDFFVEVMLSRGGTGVNVDRLKAIVRRELNPDAYADMWPQISEVLRYRNLLAHGWRHDYGFSGGPDGLTLRRYSESGELTEHLITPEETDRVATMGDQATQRLGALQDTLATLARERWKDDS
jgi:hypothetical protein